MPVRQSQHYPLVIVVTEPWFRRLHGDNDPIAYPVQALAQPRPRGNIWAQSYLLIHQVE